MGGRGRGPGTWGRSYRAGSGGSAWGMVGRMAAASSSSPRSTRVLYSISDSSSVYPTCSGRQGTGRQGSQDRSAGVHPDWSAELCATSQRCGLSCCLLPATCTLIFTLSLLLLHGLLLTHVDNLVCNCRCKRTYQKAGAPAALEVWVRSSSRRWWQPLLYVCARLSQALTLCRFQTRSLTVYTSAP